MRQVTIMPCLNGWVCTVGCQTVVFNDLDKMCEALRDYAKAPDEIEALWIKHAVNQTMTAVLHPCATEGYGNAPHNEPEAVRSTHDFATRIG